jgi:NhaP-type Na+/H+ or K+/H+ antiporter
MFARIVVGIVIGLVAGLIEAGSLSLTKRQNQIAEALAFIVGAGFIGASFVFGAVYGVMAIAEIAAGFYAFGKLFKKTKTNP